MATKNGITTKKERADRLAEEARELYYAQEWNSMIPLLDEAIEIYLKLPKNSRNASAWFFRGLALSRLNNFDGAIADLDERINMKPISANAYSSRGFAKRKIGKYEEAIIDLNESIRINSNVARPYIDRAWCYYYLDELEKSAEDFQRALELAPDNDEIGRGIAAIGKKKILEQEAEEIEAVSKSEAKVFNDNFNKLMKRHNDCDAKVSFLNVRITRLMIAVAAIIAAYLILVIIIPNYGKLIEVTFSFGALFSLSILVILIFPLVWSIRILIDAREKCEILREEYYRRAMADATIRQSFKSVYFEENSDEWRTLECKAWMDYINQWMHSSAAELILQHNDKKGNSVQPPVEVIINKVRDSVIGEEK